MGDGMDYATPENAEIDRVAQLLMDEWERVEGKPVNASYVATFVDMARTVIADQKELLDAHKATIRVAIETMSRLTDMLAESYEELAELNGAINWNTTCLNCASVLDSSYESYVRAEKAERQLKERE